MIYIISFLKFLTKSLRLHFGNVAILKNTGNTDVVSFQTCRLGAVLAQVKMPEP